MRIRREYEENTKAPPKQPACRWLADGFGVALVWLWCGLGVALVWPWGGLGVALGWLCTPESMPSICLLYGFVVALGGLQPFLVQSSRFDVRRSTFSLPPEPQTQESHPSPI